MKSVPKTASLSSIKQHRMTITEQKSPAPDSAEDTGSSSTTTPAKRTQDEQQDDFKPKFNCDQIRSRIKKLLAGEEISEETFLETLGASLDDYRRFMSYHGPQTGSNNVLFSLANRYFMAKSNPKSTTRKRQRTEKQLETDAFIERINGVELPQTVVVYDSCDEVRAKITELLATGSLTQAAFLKALDINSNSLRTFLKYSGEKKGSGNCTYLKAYCFLERMRIADGIEKTPERIANELKMPDGYSFGSSSSSGDKSKPPIKH